MGACISGRPLQQRAVNSKVWHNCPQTIIFRIRANIFVIMLKSMKFPCVRVEINIQCCNVGGTGARVRTQSMVGWCTPDNGNCALVLWRLCAATSESVAICAVLLQSCIAGVSQRLRTLHSQSDVVTTRQPDNGPHCTEEIGCITPKSIGTSDIWIVLLSAVALQIYLDLITVSSGAADMSGPHYLKIKWHFTYLDRITLISGAADISGPHLKINWHFTYLDRITLSSGAADISGPHYTHQWHCLKLLSLFKTAGTV